LKVSLPHNATDLPCACSRNDPVGPGRERSLIVQPVQSSDYLAPSGLRGVSRSLYVAGQPPGMSDELLVPTSDEKFESLAVSALC
jgi:hypothetical protein